MSRSSDSSERLARLEAALGSDELKVTPQEKFAELVRLGLADLPLPGIEGATASRFALLRCLGRHDLSLARLVEGHADAVAILAEAGTQRSPDMRLGVWAAGPVPSLRASRQGTGWRLEGMRRWCSGAPVLTHALVRAAAEDEEQLFLVPLDLAGIEPIAGSWPAVGMAASETLDVAFDRVALGPEAPIGKAGFYLARRGFWIGALGVAAVWLGGAEAIAAAVLARRNDDPHRLAHLGAITARLVALDALLTTATQIVEIPTADVAVIERLARIVRAEIEQGATEILRRTGRATGAGPLAHDAVHARRVADLTLFLRQTHGEADLAALGAIEQALAAIGGPQ